jgi:hypothetical protein
MAPGVSHRARAASSARQVRCDRHASDAPADLATSFHLPEHPAPISRPRWRPAAHLVPRHRCCVLWMRSATAGPVEGTATQGQGAVVQRTVASRQRGSHFASASCPISPWIQRSSSSSVARTSGSGCPVTAHALRAPARRNPRRCFRGEAETQSSMGVCAPRAGRGAGARRTSPHRADPRGRARTA